MSTFGFLVLTVFFGYLAYDAYQFHASSRHRPWAVVPPPELRHGDYLSQQSQAGLQSNKLTAIGGIPGLHWVFCVLTVGSGLLTVWTFLVDWVL